MTKPVYDGMPRIDRTYQIGHWGNIRCGGGCKDDYARIVTWHDHGRIVTLQKAAADSFKSAEAAVGFPITLTGSFRACSYQAALYRSDSGRFANPDTSAHCRGLAIDVSMSLGTKKLNQIAVALIQRQWHQARPDDEPWHYSFGIRC